jgi:hypothetical protein
MVKRERAAPNGIGDQCDAHRKDNRDRIHRSGDDSRALWTVMAADGKNPP